MTDSRVSVRRPKYLNLFKIRLPLPGFVSILHRISGMLLILALPIAIFTLDVAIGSEQGYSSVANAFAHPLIKLIAFAFLWALYHHLCAGLRFLLIEMHIGVELAPARISAAIALVAGIVLAIVHGWVLLL